MKLNLGCGMNHMPGYINVDCFAEAKPDIVCNLERERWPWADSSVQEVQFIHSLEHMGATTETFFHIIKELYRVCAPGAVVTIHVPHPRHDGFISDPTHVRIITPYIFGLFNKKRNREWQEQGISNTPLGLYLDVDFEMVSGVQVLDPLYGQLKEGGHLSEEELNFAIREKNNVVLEYHITLHVLK